MRYSITSMKSSAVLDGRYAVLIFPMHNDLDLLNEYKKGEFDF